MTNKRIIFHYQYVFDRYILKQILESVSLASRITELKRGTITYQINKYGNCSYKVGGITYMLTDRRIPEESLKEVQTINASIPNKLDTKTLAKVNIPAIKQNVPLYRKFINKIISYF